MSEPRRREWQELPLCQKCERPEYIHPNGFCAEFVPPDRQKALQELRAVADQLEQTGGTAYASRIRKAIKDLG